MMKPKIADEQLPQLQTLFKKNPNVTMSELVRRWNKREPGVKPVSISAMEYACRRAGIFVIKIKGRPTSQMMAEPEPEVEQFIEYPNGHLWYRCLRYNYEKDTWHRLARWQCFTKYCKICQANLLQSEAE